MQFSLTTVKNGIKRALDVKERSQRAGIEIAIALALDDLANRLQSVSMMASAEQTVAISSRTVEVRGPSDDLRTIFALKWSTDVNQKLLEYVAPEEFLKIYDSPGAVADIPSFWTILTSNEGFPVVKFNVPTSKADTLTVLYFIDLTQDNIASVRSASPIVTGGLAYFYGTADGGKGQNYYEQFKEQVVSMRSKDKFRSSPMAAIKMSKDDTDILAIQNNYRRRRA